jgi:hypothetical protein
VFHKCEEEALKRAEMRLRRQAAHLGFRIIPAEEVDCSLGVGQRSGMLPEGRDLNFHLTGPCAK